jgi:hypothetical protein
LLNTRIPAIRSQALIGVSVFVLALLLAWQIGGRIIADDERSMLFGILILTGCAVAVTILKNWRLGFYLFFVWMMFEDLVRKYMGNGVALFFGKEILLAFVYFAFFMEVRRGREKRFRPPFLLFFSLFFWLGILQIFNQNSSNILYGLLGFKLYFYYFPLLFVGYALIRTDEDLRKFLVASAVISGVVGLLGIAQAILGNSFLNPTTLAPELENLGNLTKVTPLTGQTFSLPSSVFVSSGRFAEYLTVAFVLAMGTAAYLLFYTRRNRKVVFVVLGILGVATLLSGSRTAFVTVIASAIVLPGAYLWGAPWRQRQAHRMIKAIRRSVIVTVIAFAALLFFYPEAAGTRLAFFTETLNPESSVYEGVNRSWDYPIQNLLSAFAGQNWLLGNGIGTASLGGQYIAKFLGRNELNISVEEGYGQMIVEMGIVAPFLWVLWTASLLYYSWKVVRTLRGTRLFPIGFAILWFAFVLLYPLTYEGLVAYENYVSNAYLWLLVGILFRLPELLQPVPTPVFVPARQAGDGGRSYW